MDIIIITLNGTRHSMRVNPEDTVGSVKTRIHKELGHPPHMQKLVFVNGQKTVLSDDFECVSSYGLQSGSQVSLLVTQPATQPVPQPATIQVFLRNEKGQTNTYHVKPDESVIDFRTKVQLKEEVQASQQRLLHQSREMMDGRLLSDYNVTELSTIDLTFRLRGG